MKKKFSALCLIFVCLMCTFLFCGCGEKIIDHKITVTSSNIRYGETLGDGYYKTNQEVVLLAQPNNGHNFVCWIKDDKIISTQSEYKFVANKKTEGKYIAVFDGEQMQILQLSNIFFELSSSQTSGSYILENIVATHDGNTVFSEEQSIMFDFQSPTSVVCSISTDKIFWLDNQYYFSIALTIKDSLDQQKTFVSNFIIQPTYSHVVQNQNEISYSVKNTFSTTNENLEIYATFNFTPILAISE